MNEASTASDDLCKRSIDNLSKPVYIKLALQIANSKICQVAL